MQLQLIAIAGLAASFAYAAEPVEAVERIQDARMVLQEVMGDREKSIPEGLLEKAHCVAIVPGLKKGALIVGAKYGKGVLMCREESGGWTGPGTIRVEGGSIGLQVGGGEVDLILLVMNENGAKHMVQSEFKMGGTAGVMAGPVGRSVQAETDAYLRAELLGYSRANGVFAGAALEGSTIRQDLDDNQAIYGERLTNEQILFGHAKPVPEAAKPLVQLLNSYSTWEKKD